MANEDYVGPEYQGNSAVESFRGVPRFGKTNDFSVLFSGDGDDAAEYGEGLVFVSAFLLAFFFVWAVTMLVFLCMGETVGFLSGRHLRQPKTSVPGGGAAPYKRARRVRITFVVCALLVIIFSILFVTQGLSSFEDTIDSADETNLEVQKLVIDAETISDALRTVGSSSRTVRDQLVQDLGNFCPGNPNLEDDTGYDFDGLASDTINKLDALEDFIDDDMSDFALDLGEAKDATIEVDDAIDEHGTVWVWQTLLFVIPLIALPSILLIGTIVAWMGVSPKWLQISLSWVVLPLFVVMMMVTIFAVCFFSAFGTVNADFCSGGDTESPGGTVQDILAQLDYDADDLIYEGITYYVQGCRTEFPFEFLTDYEEELKAAVGEVKSFVGALEDVTVPTLTDLCGKDMQPVSTMLDTMDGNLGVLQDNAKLVLDVISCERINALYTKIFHDTTCETSVTGIAWVFSSLLIVSVCGMVMITLRASWRDVECFDPDGKGEQGGTVHPEQEYTEEEYLKQQQQLQQQPDDQGGEVQAQETFPAGAGSVGAFAGGMIRETKEETTNLDGSKTIKVTTLQPNGDKMVRVTQVPAAPVVAPVAVAPLAAEPVEVVPEGLEELKVKGMPVAAEETVEVVPEADEELKVKGIPVVVGI